MTDSVAYFSERLNELPVIAILRGHKPEEAVALAEEAWARGVKLIEVTLQDQSGYAALEAVADAAPDGFDVGAGTITHAEQAEQAWKSGARFGIAPGLDERSVGAASQLGMAFLPGVATATEVQTAQNCGVRMTKAFPADVLTPAWFSAMAGPFPDMQFIATGGVGGGNVRTFLEAGAIGVAISLKPGSSRLAEVCDAVQK